MPIVWEETKDGNREIYYRERAMGGASLLILEQQAAHPSGMNYDAGCIAWEPRVVPQYAKLAESIAPYGCKQFVQLFAAGVHDKGTMVHDNWHPLWAASRVPSVDPLSTLLRRRSAAGTLDALLQETSVVAAAGISVPVYVHVLYSSRTNTPNVTEAQITSQISVLNASYGGQNVGAANPLPDGNNANAGVTFTLSDATPTTTGLIDFQIGRAHD